MLVTLVTFTCNWQVQSPASWYQLLKPRNVARHPVYTQRVSLVLAHVLAKVRNFECVASKMQRVHVTAFSCLYEHC